jgi:hypothetical protein
MSKITTDRVRVFNQRLGAIGAPLVTMQTIIQLQTVTDLPFELRAATTSTPLLHHRLQ